jgi:hypothetical protein
MKKSVKALLWSGLAFPGVGHFYLKRHTRGLMIFIPALLGTVLYVRGVFQEVDYVMDKLESGSVALDPVAIAAMLDNVPHSQITDIAFWVFVVCWLAGMVDAYLLGEQIEKNQTGAVKPQA